MPPSTVFIDVPPLRRALKFVPHEPGLFLLTGTLTLGGRDELHGRRSWVRLELERPAPAATPELWGDGTAPATPAGPPPPPAPRTDVREVDTMPASPVPPSAPRRAEEPARASVPTSTPTSTPGNRTVAAHTGSDIPCSAGGVGASLFTGVMDNTDVYFRVMQAVLGGVKPR